MRIKKPAPVWHSRSLPRQCWTTESISQRLLLEEGICTRNTYCGNIRTICGEIQVPKRNCVVLNLTLKQTEEGNCSRLTPTHANAILSATCCAFVTSIGSCSPLSSYALNSPPMNRIVVSNTLHNIWAAVSSCMVTTAIYLTRSEVWDLLKSILDANSTASLNRSYNWSNLNLSASLTQIYRHVHYMLFGFSEQTVRNEKNNADWPGSTLHLQSKLLKFIESASCDAV